METAGVASVTAPEFESLRITRDMLPLLSQRGLRIRVGKFRTRTLFEPPVAFFQGVTSYFPNRMGAFSYTGSHVSHHVESIGCYCSFATGIRFGTVEHATDWLTTSSFTYDPHFWGDYCRERARDFPPMQLPNDRKHSPIRIGNDVWIGEHAYIRSGVSIGDGAIIGTNAVVTKDVPPYAIVVGNPGRVVKLRFPENTVERLLASQWWRFAFTDLAAVRIGHVEQAMEDLEGANAQPYAPGWISLPGLVNGLRWKVAEPASGRHSVRMQT